MSRRHGWIKPLVEITCNYVHNGYPLTVRINFENGVSRRYRDDEINQPPPGSYFRPMQNPVVGYQFGRKNKIAVPTHHSEYGKTR